MKCFLKSAFVFLAENCVWKVHCLGPRGEDERRVCVKFLKQARRGGADSGRLFYKGALSRKKSSKISNPWQRQNSPVVNLLTINHTHHTTNLNFSRRNWKVQVLTLYLDLEQLWLLWKVIWCDKVSLYEEKKFNNGWICILFRFSKERFSWETMLMYVSFISLHI